MLTPAGIEAVAEMLAKNEGLRILAVGDVSLGDAGLATLVEGIIAHGGLTRVSQHFPEKY
jgi:hypothetical protein